MKKNLCVMTCLALALSCSALAQDSTSPSDPPSKASIIQFLELMQLKTRMVQMIEGMKKSMKAGAEAGFKQKIPNATPGQLAKIDSVADTVFQSFPYGEMLEAMVPIYQRHLTKSDLDAVISFYSSPVAQKLLKEQPAMMAESMQAGHDIMLSKVGDIRKRLDAQMAQIADQESKNAPLSGKPSVAK
jgi:hypothetical protein